jgi:2-hydroxychromene-2-carboxylate isomerase
MAKALFAAPPEKLTPAGCEAIAIEIGCDLTAYRDAWGSTAVRDRIERDIADAKAAGLEGFPTIYIGKRKFEGSDHAPATLLAAIESAH